MFGGRRRGEFSPEGHEHGVGYFGVRGAKKSETVERDIGLDGDGEGMRLRNLKGS